MTIVLVPNHLSDEIDRKLDAAIAECPDAAKEVGSRQLRPRQGPASDRGEQGAPEPNDPRAPEPVARERIPPLPHPRQGTHTKGMNPMADALCFRLRTRKEQALSVAARWRDQYMRDDRDKGWRFSDGRTTDEIWNALKVAKTADEMDTVIGNNSWTHLTCDVCQQYRAEIVEVGTEWSDKTSICGECLLQAKAFFDGMTAPSESPTP